MNYKEYKGLIVFGIIWVIVVIVVCIGLSWLNNLKGFTGDSYTLYEKVVKNQIYTAMNYQTDGYARVGGSPRYMKIVADNASSEDGDYWFVNDDKILIKYPDGTISAGRAKVGCFYRFYEVNIYTSQPWDYLDFSQDIYCYLEIIDPNNKPPIIERPFTYANQGYLSYIEEWRAEFMERADNDMRQYKEDCCGRCR